MGLEEIVSEDYQSVSWTNYERTVSPSCVVFEQRESVLCGDFVVAGYDEESNYCCDRRSNLA
jgi:hypothetical protein